MQALLAAVRRAVLALARDEDPGVREAACRWLAHHRGPEPEVEDALVALTHDERQSVRIGAVSGLAHRDDPRCVEAEHRIGPLGPEPPFDPRLLDVSRYRRRRERAAGS
ncbi:HEAT repeat domain-containing protein [Streptomyces sp. NPDC085931]|uniref:HEAT repeat domain-containing protein n=1 Tax=Streptomyces sp. NPDC085931 TaxID=3365740 RepID=UPI0037CD1979